MSTPRVTAEQLTIHPHPDADRLELAQVGLYRAVVPKGRYRTGDWAVYIPEGTVLPPELIEDIGLVGKLAGKDGGRVKAVRLRGELSQGIVCNPTKLAGVDLEAAAADGEDFAEILGVTKWVPPVPATLSGQVIPDTRMLPWCEIENIRRYPEEFKTGELVWVTEKLHGSACCMTFDAASCEVWVSSKGFSQQRLGIVEDTTNTYWRAVRGYDLPALAADIAALLGADVVALFGEVYGTGVQDLPYGARHDADRPGYALFDIAYTRPQQPVAWLPSAQFYNVFGMFGRGVARVPLLYHGPFDIDRILALAEGPEQVTGRELHMREGVVIRPDREGHSLTLGGRRILKAVGATYLTRDGGTEYE